MFELLKLLLTILLSPILVVSIIYFTIDNIKELRKILAGAFRKADILDGE